MRTLAIVGVVVLILALLFVPGLIGHFRQVPKDIGAAIDRSVPRSHLEGVVESDFNRAEQELKERYVELYKVKTKVAELESTLKVQKQELQKREQIMQRAKDLLGKSKSGSTIVVAGNNFSWEQINQDALNQLNACKVLRKQVEGNEQSLSKLKQAYEQGLKAISDKQEELRRAKLDFDAEKAELAALMAQEEVNAMVASISSRAVGFKTDIGLARKAYSDRLNELRARAEYDQQMGLVRSATVVPWDKEMGTTEKAVEGIESYFQEGKAQAREEKPQPSPVKEDKAQPKK